MRALIVLSFFALSLSISLTADAQSSCHEIFAPKRLTFRTKSSLLEGTEAAEVVVGSVTLGEVTYAVRDDELLTIVGVRVNDNARRGRVQEFMFAEILRRHPEVQEVKAELAQTNAEVIRSYLDAGMDLEQAIVLSPTARSLQRLGFTKLEVATASGQGPRAMYNIRLARP